MNKAFKVIWNHATQSWTAVSEIARAKGKTKSVKSAKTAIALAVATAGTMASTQAMAAQAAAGTVVYDSSQGLSVSYGIATGNSQAVAIGGDSANPARALAAGAIAIGGQANATGTTSTAIGWNSTASGADSVAYGASTRASAVNTVAIGKGANATSTANSAVAIGDSSKPTAPTLLQSVYCQTSLAVAVWQLVTRRQQPKMRRLMVSCQMQLPFVRQLLVLSQMR